ncbi:MAG TPA: ABC transporter permease [Bacilli bacterium]
MNRLKIGQAFKMAFKSILSNKLRSVLTMLGIIIGVMAVIALVSIGKGTTKSVTDQIQNLGTNLLSVNIIGRGAATTIDYDKAASFANLPNVQYISPIHSQNAMVKFGTTSKSVNVTGTNPDYAKIRNVNVSVGRFLSEIDLLFYEKVALLGANTATDLFGNANPVGQSVLINGIRFKVVGLLAPKGSSLAGSDDDGVLIPVTTAQRIFRAKGIRTLYVQVDNADNMDAVVNELDNELAKIFRGDTDSYRVLNQQDILDTVSSISNTLALALGGIAGISLLVGGIGIMNIMLVSVTERTREIGIRKALGAKTRDILVQFLIESIVLSGFGGLIGIAIGIGVASAASRALKISSVFSPDVILVAFGFSVMIGVIFGMFPANRAAKLKPIDALRFD